MPHPYASREKVEAYAAQLTADCLREMQVEGHARSDLSFDEQAHFRLQLAALTASADRRAAIESEAAHVGRRAAKHRRVGQ